MMGQAVGLGFSSGPSASGQDSATRPNVLVVVTDDQRVDTMFFMPRTRGWLRDGGTEFREAYANTPLCCPFRASLMSGRYQHNHGVANNQSPDKLDQAATIQKYLRDSGYLTAIDGKYLTHWPFRMPPPNFDRWAVFLGGYHDVKWNIDGAYSTPDQYVTDFQGDVAVGFLDDFEAEDERPWYLYLTPQAPHMDFTAAPRHVGAPVPPWEPNPAVLEADRTDKPAWVQRHRAGVDASREARDAQLRTLLALDEMLDRVFRHLAERGELDNTLVVYTSDSGWHWGEHGLQSKSTPYTGSVDVPFFLRWPGVVPAGATDARPAAVVDVLPTLLDAASVTTPVRYPPDGRSLLGPGGRSESLLEWHESPDFSAYPSWASIRNRSFQYIEWYADAEGTKVGFSEYYDLAADPWQLTNMLGDGDPANDPDPALVGELAARLARYRTCAGTTGATACP